MPDVNSNVGPRGSQVLALNSESAFTPKAYPPDMLTLTIPRTPSPKESSGDHKLFFECNRNSRNLSRFYALNTQY